MTIPAVTAFQGRTGCRLDFGLKHGGRVSVYVLRSDLVRVLFLPDDAPRLPRVGAAWWWNILIRPRSSTN